MTHLKPTFPSQPMNPATELKLAAPIRIRHPRMAEVIDELQIVIHPKSNTSLLVVCGPPGAGKTTLGKYLVEAEVVQQTPAISLNPALVPAILVEAPASGENEFSWRLFYERILIALEGDLDAPRAEYGVDAATGRVVRPVRVRIPRQSGHRFHANLDSDSKANWTVICS